jgi:hypothetical protein
MALVYTRAVPFFCVEFDMIIFIMYRFYIGKGKVMEKERLCVPV